MAFFRRSRLTMRHVWQATGAADRDGDECPRVGPLAPWRGSLAAGAGLAIALAVYFALGLYQLELPGFYYDEAFDALPALEMRMGIRPDVAMSVPFLGRYWPVMLHPHIGPTSTYVDLLAFWIVGPSVEAVRGAHLAVGALTLVLLWSLARRWFGDLVAVSATILCATAPPFVWWNRAGANWSATLLPLALGLVLALSRWMATRSTLALAAAALLLGAGLATKINFVWLCPPIALTALMMLGPVGLMRALRGVSGRGLAGALVAFLVGASPLLLYNLRTAGETLRFVAGNAVHTEYGQDNLAVLHNVAFLARDFTSVMGGSTGEFPAPSGGRLPALVFVASAIYLSVRCLRSRRRYAADGGALFLALMIGVLFTLGTVTTSRVGARHLFMLVPFAWLVVAVATGDARGALRRGLDRHRRVARAAAALPIVLLAAIVLGHVSDHRNIHRFLTATGGYGVWSSAISTLSERLETTYASRTPLAMDWGLMRNVAFISSTRVVPREAFEYRPQPSPQFHELAATLIRDPRNLYVFHTPAFTEFRGYREALDASGGRGRQAPRARRDARATRRDAEHPHLYRRPGTVGAR